MIASCYWPSCNAFAIFACYVTGTLMRIILEFALPKDGLLVAVGTYANTCAGGLYDYDDFKKFANWDAAVGAKDAVDYGLDARKEVCPQGRYEDWTGLDSFLCPVISFVVLLVVHFVA